MKHIKLYEEFINESLKAGRDEPIARAIIAYRYAVEGSGREKAIFDMGLNPERSDSNPDQMEYLSGWGKDVIKALSGARRVPSKYMTGTVITLAADNGNSYYFDGGDLVEGDKTIVRNALKLTWTQLIDELIKLKVIEEPKY